MICKIADITVRIPEIGDLPTRCREYVCGEKFPDIDISKPKMIANIWPQLTTKTNYYLISTFRFYQQLLQFDGLMLHASAVVVDGYAYLFSGPSGSGKSTHTEKYLRAFPNSVVINDDSPALRKIGKIWYAYGTPWCGKTGINSNQRAPIAGICFLKHGKTWLQSLRAEENIIPLLLSQTLSAKNEEWAFLWENEKWNELLMHNLKSLAAEVPFFEFYNSAEAGAEMITFNEMCRQKSKRWVEE